MIEPQSDKPSAVPSRSSYYFLSYSRDDIVNTCKRYKEIRRWGGLLWMDEVELRLGVAWDDVLQSHVETARGLIA